MKKLKHLLAFLLIAVLLSGFVACGGEEPSTDTQTGTAGASDAVSQTENSDVAPEPEPEPILYVNPLTGEKTETDTNGSRPIAVMVNNIKQSLPQEGISEADILLECLVEGGITRLMAVFSDYKDLEVIGSVRSARPYYLDFAQMFDAIYCHAGASTEADSEIRSRGINNIDGVKKDPLRVYYRDAERLKTMDLEHTMMTNGEGITKTIEYYKYRTTLRDGYAYPFAFPTEETSVQVGTADALHIYLPISKYQNVDYVYNTETAEYLRYQYNGQKHMDSHNNTQLSFKNVIVLFCKTTTIRDGLLSVTTTGTGTGYLISEGKYTAIHWSRDSREGNLTLTDAATGAPLVINRGKTAVNVCPQSIAGNVNLNATNRTVNP